MRKAGKLIFCPLFILFGFILSPEARAQDPRPSDQDEPIRLKADLVTITTAVLDRGGRPIKSLKVADFAVYEDGKKQKIDHLAPTEEPFTLLLVLDISGSTREDLALIKRAAVNFLAELRNDDRVGLIVFSGDVELVADFADPRAKVEAAIDQIASADAAEGHRFSAKTGTSFYDALFLAVDESPLKHAEGRKAIVCMTDGVDSSSKLTYQGVARLVEQSEASVYFLELNTQEGMLEGLLKPRTDPGYINLSESQVARYYDRYDPESIDRYRPRQLLTPLALREISTGLYEIAHKELTELAERTGGRLYPVRSLSDLVGVYKQVADDLRSQYSISYYPGNETHDGRWRTVRVEVRQKDANVRARSGYWAPGGKR